MRKHLDIKKGEPTFAYRISGLSTACMTDKCKVAHTLWGYSAQWHIHVQGESVLRLSCHACVSCRDSLMTELLERFLLLCLAAAQWLQRCKVSNTF